MVRSAMATSVPCLRDCQESDALGRELDISGREMNRMNGGELDIGPEPELLSVQKHMRCLGLLGLKRQAIRLDRQDERRRSRPTVIDREERHAPGGAPQAMRI